MELGGDIYTVSGRAKGWQFYCLGFMAIPLILKFLLYIRKTEDEQFLNQLFVSAIGLACQQGWHLLPSQFPLKVFIIASSFSVAIFHMQFSSILVSNLSLYMSPIQSLSDLIRFGYKFATDEDSGSLRMYADGFSSYFHTANVAAIPDSEAVAHMLKPRSAYLAYWTSVAPLEHFDFIENSRSGQFVCEEILSLKAGHQAGLPSGFTLKRGSPYKELFNTKYG